MNKSELVIGGVRAAEFSIYYKLKVPLLNNIMVIAITNNYSSMPDSMPRRVITKKDYKFKRELTKKITWRGFRICKGRLNRIYMCKNFFIEENFIR